MAFRFDYSKTVMMKLGIGLPDNKGGCKLYNTFEQALEKIRIVDSLTLGVPKIVYLVGWQYNGHDDKYPAFFAVNEAAKRPQDRDARESLLWLMAQAKKYHTTVSLHINLSDAYPDSPLWETYLKKNLILCDRRGEPKVTGEWNGRKAYQVRFAEEYRSGWFQKRVDALLELLPVADAGTIHVDAFFVRRGKDTKIGEEKAYRRKMVEYFRSKGIDVTSEFIYREWNCGYRSFWGTYDLAGLVPAVWNLRMTQKDYLRYPPQLLAGGRLNMGIQWDRDLQYLFYGNAQGESCFQMGDGWEAAFTKEFALDPVPYFFLNAHRLEKIIGYGKNRSAHFAGGVETAIRGKTIREKGRLLKEGETLCIPLAWAAHSYYAWSSCDCVRQIEICASAAEIWRITADGPHLLEQQSAADGKITLRYQAGEAYWIKEKEWTQ